VHCLNNNVSPAYIVGGDGVFFLPDTFSEQFKVNVLNTLVVEDLIAAVAVGLEKTLRTEITKFWTAPAKTIRPDTTPLSNKQTFIEAYAVVTSAELSLSVMANNFDAWLGERFAHLLDADAGRAVFEVKLQPAQDYLLSLPALFRSGQCRASGGRNAAGQRVDFLSYAHAGKRLRVL
jgi:hypothetical protein